MTTTKTADVEGTLPADLRPGRGRAATSCAAPATRSRPPRGWPRSCPGRRCRSSPTSTTSTGWRSPPSRPACTACASTPATSAGPSTSRPWPPRRRDRGVPDPHRRQRRLARPRRSTRSTAARSPPEAMVESALRELAYFDEVGFDDVKISVKASNVPLMIEAYRLLADDRRLPAAPRGHRGRARRRPGCSRPPPASPRCWPRASATPSATRSPPIRSRRPGPDASCSRPWACGSARTSTSSPARRAVGPRST